MILRINLRPDGRLELVDDHDKETQRTLRQRRAGGADMKELGRWLEAEHGIILNSKGVWRLMVIGVDAKGRSSDPLM